MIQLANSRRSDRLTSAFAAFATLLSFAVAAPALADADYGRSGFYVGGGVAYATDIYEDEIEDALNTGFDVNIEDTFGLNARAGYRLLSFAALELQYEWLDDYEIEVANAGGSSVVDTQTLTANLKLYLPLQRFQPYVLAGIGFQRFEIDSNYFGGTVRFSQDDYELAGRVGLGFDVYLTEHLAVYAEGSAVLSDAKITIPIAGSVDQLFYAGFQGGLLWRF